ncbi:hypothetical protein GCM10023340_39630 [Nocardioides marinquilinus]|uniref:FHA domain-containing protein n=1 Tax=Nocardioides marinquilinus TaxID=1210400 RepID=A0ABP9Q135_9ACTN
MATLVVELDGRTLRFGEPRLIRIGRSIDADVLLTAPSVSRVHAELRPVEDGWVLVDSGSQFGTFVEGARVHEQRIDRPTRVQCGPPARGSTFSVAVEQVAPAAPPTPVPVPSSAPPPTAPHPPPPQWGAPSDRLAAGPPGQPAPPALEHTQVLSLPRDTVGLPGARSGPDLLVVAQGREHRFRHPAQLRIGRAPDCEVVVDAPVVSRLHGLVAAVPGGWTFTDQSAEGSFDQGRRVRTTRFDERLDLRLGHPVAGPPLSLVPILSAAEEERRFARRRRNRVLVVVGAVVAVLALVAASAVTAVLLTRDGTGGVAGGGSSSSLDVLSSAELDSAKAATVLLIGETDDQGPYAGSGSIIRSDGLILTNAHVAQPTAEGLEENYGEVGRDDPDYLLVALVEGDDEPAAPEYRARPVQVDGVADAAVLEIYADADGNEVDTGTLDLPTMPIGDSGSLASGDDVTVLGFPGISGSTRLTVTTGVVSTFIDVDGLGPRSEIDTDARIAPGNSGGAAINNDAEIIGIPSALFDDGTSNVVSGRIRAIDAVRDLIEAAEAG